jgi:hypothetical protein
MCRSSIEPSCTIDPIARIPYKVYPNERIVNNSMLCLVCKLLVEDEWSIGPLLMMVFLCGLC